MVARSLVRGLARGLVRPVVGGTGEVVAPVLRLSGNTVTEPGGIVGQLSVDNLDALTVSSYAIIVDTDSKFDIAGDTVSASAVDYETATSHSFTGEATLSDASTVSAEFTITVFDAVETPSPVVANQSARFGALTQAGRGDWVPVNTGGAITSASIDSGDPSGHFQISAAGHITPSTAGDTANLSGGTYTLGCTFTNAAGSDGATITVTIDANAYDVYSQSDWDTDIVLSAATLAGKTIYCRPSISLTSGVDGTAARLRRNDYGDLTITSRDFTNKATFNKFVLRGTRNVIFDGLNTQATTEQKFRFIAESANHIDGITVKRCVIQGVAFDPHYDFSDGSYPNEDLIATNGTASWVENISILDNHIKWAASAVNMRVGVGQVIVSGNLIEYFYDDGIGLTYGGDAPAFVEQNVICHPMGLHTDAPRPGQSTGPHVDHIRFIGSTTATTDWEIHVNANRLFKGDARGEQQCILASDFKAAGVDSGHFFTGEMIGNAAIHDGTSGQSISIENASSFYIANNTLITSDLTPAALIKLTIGTGSTDSTTTGPHTLERNIADDYLIGGTPVMTDNVELGSGGATIPYTTVFDGSAPWTPTDLASFMTKLNRKAAGPADLGGAYDAGAIGSGAVTWATTSPGSDGTVHVTPPAGVYDLIAWGNSHVEGAVVPNFDSGDGTPPDYDTEFFLSGVIYATTDSNGTDANDRWPEKVAIALSRDTVDVNQGVGGEGMDDIYARFTVASSDLKARTTFLWWGNNPDDYLADFANIEDLVAELGHNRFLIFSPGLDNADREEMQDLLMANWPNNTFLTFDYLDSLSGTTTPAFPNDATDTAANRIGRSMRHDSNHLNARGHAAIAAVAQAWVVAIEGGVPYIMPEYPAFVQPDDDIAEDTVVTTLRWYGTPTSWTIVSGDDDDLYSIADGVITRNANAGTLENTTLVVKATNGAGDSNTLEVVMEPNITAAAMTTPILLLAAQSNSVPSTSSVRYTGMVGGLSVSGWQSSEADARHMASAAGTLGNLRVKLTTAPSPGSWTFDLMINGVAVGTSLVLSGTDTDGFLSGPIGTLAQGDTYSIRCTPASSPTATFMHMSMTFGSAVAEGLVHGTSPTLLTTGTGYIPVGGRRAANATETNVAIPMPTAGVFDRLFARLTAAPGSGVTHTFTLMKNGVATALTCAMTGTGSGNGITFASDVTNSVSYAAGDTISLRQVVSGGTAAASQIKFNMVWTPTVPGETPLFSLSTSNMTASRYFNMNGNGLAGSTTESDAYNIAPVAFTLKKARGRLSAAPGVGDTRVLTGRVNGASSTLVLNFGAADTTASDVAHDVAVAAGDTVNWLEAVTGTPDAATGYFSAVAFIDP